MSYLVTCEFGGKPWFVGRGIATMGSMEICVPISTLTGMSAVDIGQTVLALLPIAVKHLEADTREMAEQQGRACRLPPRVEKPKRQPKPGHVYVICLDGKYKIGQTTNLESRLKAFTTELPGKVEVVQVIATPYPRQLEKTLHATYADKRINGEWFALDNADIVALKEVKGHPDEV